MDDIGERVKGEGGDAAVVPIGEMEAEQLETALGGRQMELRRNRGVDIKSDDMTC